MRKFFKDIVEGRKEEVIRQVEKNPALVNAAAKQPPKKYDDHSSLMLAIESWHFDLANYLIDKGADIHFVAERENPNGWHMPILNLAFMMATRACRHTYRYGVGDYHEEEVISSKEKADAAYALVRRLIDMETDVNGIAQNGIDGLPMNCAKMVYHQASFFLPGFVEHPERMSPECREDLTRLFRLLREYHADYSDEFIMRDLKRPECPTYPFVRLLAQD